MAKIIHQRKKNFTTISNKVINDNRLKLQDKGLFLVMWSKPDSWKFSIRRLVAILNDGESKIRASLKRLCETGYIQRYVVRDKETNKNEAVYKLSDEGDFGRVDFQHDDCVDFDRGQNDHGCFTHDETTAISNTDNRNKRMYKERENKKESSSLHKPTIEEVQNYAEEHKISNINIEYFYSYWQADDDIHGFPQNWRQKLLSWSRNEHERRKTNQQAQDSEIAPMVVTDEERKKQDEYELWIREHAHQGL